MWTAMPLNIVSEFAVVLAAIWRGARCNNVGPRWSC